MADCLILGYDGFDLDVAHNVRRLYAALGYRVFSSRVPRGGDLIAVHRPPNTRIDLSTFPIVHVWDYVGTEVTSFVESVQTHEGLTWFASTAERSGEIRRKYPTIADRVVVAAPPVAIADWARHPVASRYEAIHVGNYKPSYASGEDQDSVAFLDYLRRYRIPVWGAGWSGIVDPSQAMGPATLRDVSDLYAQSTIALGMMYPYQRAVTFSGRFWQAPLSGAELHSERTTWGSTSPGVEQIDYSTAGAPGERSLVERQALRALALDWWAADANRTREIVRQELAAQGSVRGVRVPFHTRVYSVAAALRHRPAARVRDT